jgi:hypothetical protein
MKKKVMLLLLASIVALSGCGNTGAGTNNDSNNSQTENSQSSLDSNGGIDVEENLFSVELTIPSDLVGETTQAELDAIAKDKGYKSITLNEDGSATYVMTKTQHKEMLKELSDNINASLGELVNSEDYPNITKITANEDFTSFTVTTKSTELSLAESFSVLSFYTYGGMYNVFAGETVDNIHVDFINEASGEIISSANSSDMASE